MPTIESQISFAKNNGWLQHYYEAAAFYGIPVEILLAKDSRESQLGSLPGLQANDWYGSDGISRGISQINDQQFPFAKYTDPNDVRAYVAKGAEILADELDRFDGNMKAALAAYNAGSPRVSTALATGKDPDSVTSGKDYGSDVIRRSREIKQLLTGETSPMLIVSSGIGAVKGNLPLILGIGVAAYGLYYMGNRYGYV